MAPIRLNRRRFLGYSAAAGLAITQGIPVEGASAVAPVRLGVLGLGNRGTTLLRGLLELPGIDVRAVCDIEPKHRLRAQGIVEKATGSRPEAFEHFGQVLDRPDLDAVVAALPCDLHVSVELEILKAGKHLYAEKPLALTLADCDALIAESARRPDQVAHVGFQRRSNPRYLEGVNLIRSGQMGKAVEARFSWTSSNGPLEGHSGWLGERERSGDWMVEQGVHVWDILNWIVGGPPCQAFGLGRRDVYAAQKPERDVTDHYSVMLQWPDGFWATFSHSWAEPAHDAFTGARQLVVTTRGGIDFGTGTAIVRDETLERRSLNPGSIPDTRFALAAFVAAIRAESPPPPPITLLEARDATLTGLLVRRAVDERRVVTIDEVRAST